MQCWWDRRIFGVVLISGFALGGGWALLVADNVRFWDFSIVIGVLSLISFSAKAQIRVGIALRDDLLVVRNAYCVYLVPWGRIRRVDCDAQKGIRLVIDDERVIAIDAFNSWPSFGRRLRIAQRLERGRRMSAEAPGGGDVVEVPSRGLLEFALVVPVVVMVVSLVVAGSIHLLD